MGKTSLEPLKLATRRLGHFSRRVLANFRRHKGLLLAGSVAYNTLLSIVPLFAVVLVALSHFAEKKDLLKTVNSEISLLAPAQADTLTQEISLFLTNRDVLGGLGLLVLLFFSSLAFRVLGDAMEVIFGKPRPTDARHPWMSAFIPYLYILVLGLGIGLITLFRGVLDGISEQRLAVLGLELSGSLVPTVAIYVIGLISLLFMLTSIYMVLPPKKISFKRAMAGGTIATLLWEVTRHTAVWYFSTISLVNVVYGSLATVIILLLMAEIGAIIILLGAEVIAELERASDAGRAWYEVPTRLAPAMSHPSPYDDDADDADDEEPPNADDPAASDKDAA